MVFPKCLTFLLMFFHRKMVVDGFIYRNSRVLQRCLSASLDLSPVMAANQGKGSRTFSSYNIYKKSAAVSIKPLPPTFIQKDGTSYRTISREGGIFLEFALSVGQREYDWLKKGTFFMSVTECGELLVMDQLLKNSLEFFHDPNMGSVQAGQITKKLKFVPTQDGKGVFLSLEINDKSSGPSKYNLPISTGELEVLRTVIRYCIPRFLAFDSMLDDGASSYTNDWNEGNTGKLPY